MTNILEIELIPKKCWNSNVRNHIKQKDWDKIRKLIYTNANNICEICGETGKEQGYKHNLECHEIWKYINNTHTQKLMGFIALCPLCHQTKHLGRAIYMGKKEQLVNRLANINNWSLEKTNEYILKQFEINKERSKYNWKLNILLITQNPYNIKLKLITQRKFKKIPIKRKKKTTKRKSYNKAK